MQDLKVWFVHRKGLLRELVSKGTQWVRAVDGISFDVRRGEIFCLVGESGCGKTTTGKALLQLNRPTSGDIYLEMPDSAYEELERLKASSGDPTAAKRADELRRKYSLTWQEHFPWTGAQRARLLGMIAAALAISILLPAVLFGFLAAPFSNGWDVFAYGILVGVLAGLIGSLPGSRPWRRTPSILALLSIAVAVVDPILVGVVNVTWIQRTGLSSLDALGALGAPWSDVFSMLIAVSFTAIAAFGVSAALLKWRQQSEDLGGIKMRGLRKRLHLIFQDPYESLNPKQSIFEIVSEPLRVNHLVSNPEELAASVSDALTDAGLRPPEDFMFRFPHEVSGGQRQRVSIAAALALEPDFIVADEPVSMLDVSIRTDILQLMLELRAKRGLTYLFITHDLSLAWVIANRIAVMYLGKIVEMGTAAQVIRNPRHPYTQALISVVPSPDPRHRAQRTILKGERPDPVDLPTGCRFHPRCPLAFEKCGWNAEEIREALEALIPSTPAEGAGSMTVQDPTTVRITAASGTAERLAESIRALVAEKKAESPALRGVAEVSVSGTDVIVKAAPWSEPQLQQVGPDNFVACFLVNPTPVEPAQVEAT